MKRTLSALAFMACLFIPAMSLCMDVTVEITGPPELTALKDGIGKTISVRCITRGVPVESLSKLRVSISMLGDVLSYDALLDTAPPRAFHRDLQDASAISPTIDEMISSLFGAGEEIPSPPVLKKEPTAGQQKGTRVKLPFMPTSIASMKDRVYISASREVHELSGENVSSLWKAPGNNEILRLYVHDGRILVLTRRLDTLQTFLLSGSTVEKRWDGAVIPLGEGLVSTGIKFDRDYAGTGYRWSRAVREDGSPPAVPEGLEVVSAVSAPVLSSFPGARIISYDPSGNLAISDGKSVLWAEAESGGITPLFIESKDEKVGAFSESRQPMRYVFRPRIVTSGSRIITFMNDQGLGGMLSRTILFESTQILLYSPEGNDLSKEVLETHAKSHCVDITIVNGKAAALIVQGKSAFVQFIGL